MNGQAEFEALLSRHERIALQFSGGRDSLALLLAMKPYWDKLTVYYTNSGDAYPETVALVDFIATQVPRLVKIQGKVHETIEKFGLPSDVLQPGTGYEHARSDMSDYQPLNDRHNCCKHSIMLPMHARMYEDGITLMLRGQRSEDVTKSAVVNGSVIGGIQIVFPIEHWTTVDVDNFIAASGYRSTPFYEHGVSNTPDCMHCTAWLEPAAHKYLAKFHPSAAAIVNQRLSSIKVIVQPFIDRLNQAQEILNANK